MNELSLFTGAGGGLLGTKLLGFNHIGYVEINDYCQRIIKQRIEDGILDRAPIFGDIKTFLSEGYAESYQGLVDVITAGFPCQPFSVAGNRQGESDERNMWPETIATIRIIRPQYVFLENVPGLFVHEYIRRIFGDLAESGFNARWRVLSAAEVGAPHKRDRVWIVANSKSQSSDVSNYNGKDSASEIPESGNNSCEDNVANTNKQGLQERQGFSGMGKVQGKRNKGKAITVCGWWTTEPDVGRVANGVAARVDRLKAIGNGQVSIVAKTAWELLTG